MHTRTIPYDLPAFLFLEGDHEGDVVRADVISLTREQEKENSLQYTERRMAGRKS